MFFQSRITDVWNSLPNEVVEASSVQSFEKRLDKYWDKQSVKYSFEEKLSNTQGHHISLFMDDNPDTEHTENDLDIEA